DPRDVRGLSRRARMEGVAALAGRCGAETIQIEAIQIRAIPTGEIMFLTCIFAMLLVAVSVAAAFAQPPGGQPTSNPNANASLKSTEVLPDHRVVFRIYAPKASAVTLTGDFATQGRGSAGAMQKDEDGIWSLTVGPLVPDFYSYS